MRKILKDDRITYLIFSDVEDEISIEGRIKVFLKSLVKIWQKANKGAPGENDSLIRLVQIMHRDEKFRLLVMKVINLDAEKKNTYLKEVLDDMKLKGAPDELIEMMNFLRDEAVCHKVEELSRAKSWK